MTDDRKKKILLAVLPLIIALLSIFVVSKYATSVEFNAGIIESLDEKKTTVMELTAVSTAASAAITLIPGDVATPIAEKLADLSGYFLLVICAIYLEKYLVTTKGLESSAETAEGEESGGLPGIISKAKKTVTEATTGAIKKVETVLNQFIEALAVLLVTSCVIPIIVLLFFVWLIKIIIGADMAYSTFSMRYPTPM